MSAKEKAILSANTDCIAFFILFCLDKILLSQFLQTAICYLLTATKHF